MKKVRIRYKGEGYSVSYKVETIDLSMTPLEFVNVYSVFIDDATLQGITGEHFTILQNHIHIVKPVYDVKSPSNLEEVNLKKKLPSR